ncbi:hypothetical protein H5398_02935 [Tessaracoccus sp. MC1679]|uniref:glycosyltransferase 87 family protein n=1 Tax=Tessaracoccus sp. MC1679 TaxID=2760313 RepID=UPI0015FF5FD3|nr:hypothetical protein [Tessaracoccus sp. MC1679]
MDNALLPGLGGPMGRHAAGRGLWFAALPWAIAVGTVLFLVLFLRHTQCVQTDAEVQINSYALLCYSDIQGTFLGQGFGLGATPFSGEKLAFSPLVGVAILLAVRAAALLGAPVGPGAPLQDQVDSSVAFFGITVVGLFFCFLLLIAATSRLGRRGRAQSWDAILVAGSPIVFAVGLISWDLLPLAITALGLAQYARGRALESGIVLGLAACAGTMPFAVILAVTVAAGLRGGVRQALTFAGPAAITVAAVHLPLLLADAGKVFGFYHQEIHKEAGYGSLWYLMSLLGRPLRHAGSLGFLFLALFLAVLVAYLYVSRRRPRVGSLVAVMILAATLLGPSFPPQTSLWVMFAVLVSRPLRQEWAAVSVAHVAHYLAVWGWLAGSLTLSQLGPYGVYWGAIIARAAVEAWVLASSLTDIVDPGRDPLRRPDQPDPLGGELNTGELAPIPD